MAMVIISPQRDEGHKEEIILVPRLCLGTRCPRGSASRSRRHGRQSLPGSAFPGRAWERGVRYNSGADNRKEDPMFDLTAVQSAIRQHGVDGWLLYDFRGLNVLARRVIGLDSNAMLSRRWFYYIPAVGEPKKLLHRIEPRALDGVPG